MFCIWFIPPLSLAILFIWFIMLFMLVFISPYPPPQLFAVGPMGPPMPSLPPEDEDHAAALVIVDVEVAQDHVTVEEDPDQDLDLEINRGIDQEAAPEEEADPEASPEIEGEAKRLLERRVAQDQDPNHEADLDQETLATDELN